MRDTVGRHRAAAPFSLRGCAEGLSAGMQRAVSWWRSDSTRHAVGQTLADLFESGSRVARKTHMPTRSGVLEFFGNQVLINTVAWTAGLVAASLMKHFFEVKSLRNLWGLTASRHRTLVSPDDYQLIVTLASYSAGLVMLILVRHFILRSIAEFRSLRIERERVAGASGPARSDPPASS